MVSDDLGCMTADSARAYAEQPLPDLTRSTNSITGFNLFNFTVVFAALNGPRVQSRPETTGGNTVLYSTTSPVPEPLDSLIAAAALSSQGRRTRCFRPRSDDANR